MRQTGGQGSSGDGVADFPPGCAFVVGANGGIGQGIAVAFAAAGTGVALGYRSDAAKGLCQTNVADRPGG